MLGSHWIWRNVDGYRIELNSVEKFWGLVRDQRDWGSQRTGGVLEYEAHRHSAEMVNDRTGSLCSCHGPQEVPELAVRDQSDHSDHNPSLYVTESAPKSAKLMRWSLSLQEFDVTFKYRAGRANVAADCLSRLNLDDSATDFIGFSAGALITWHYMIMKTFIRHIGRRHRKIECELKIK